MLCFYSDMKDNITVHSLAIYSSWCYHKPTRTLFDCGESCASSFRNHIYGVENILFSHNHGDHTLGLPSFVGIRNSVRGDKTKSLSVFYPEDNYGFKDLIDFIEKRNRKWLTYDLNWNPKSDNFTIELENKKRIKSFKSKHQKNATTFLYKIEETRSKLKSEYQGKNIPDLIKSGIKKEDLNESYNHVEFAYLLDSCGFDVSEIKNASEVVIDCTFLNEKDRDDPTHFSLDEVLHICETTNVKKVTLAHISPRYSYEDVKSVKNKLPEKYLIHHPLYNF